MKELRHGWTAQGHADPGPRHRDACLPCKATPLGCTHVTSRALPGSSSALSCAQQREEAQAETLFWTLCQVLWALSRGLPVALVDALPQCRGSRPSCPCSKRWVCKHGHCKACESSRNSELQAHLFSNGALFAHHHEGQQPTEGHGRKGLSLVWLSGGEGGLPTRSKGRHLESRWQRRRRNDRRVRWRQLFLVEVPVGPQLERQRKQFLIWLMLYVHFYSWSPHTYFSVSLRHDLHTALDEPPVYSTVTWLPRSAKRGPQYVEPTFIISSIYKRRKNVFFFLVMRTSRMYCQQLTTDRAAVLTAVLVLYWLLSLPSSADLEATCTGLRIREQNLSPSPLTWQQHAEDRGAL